MSLINEVLNRLEQRGAQTSPSQTEIRAVTTQPERNWKPALWVLLGVAVLLVVVWAWPKPQAVNTSLKIVESLPVEVASPHFQDVPQAVIEAPASKLSYELSMVSLPETPAEAKQSKSNYPRVESRSAKAKPAEPASAVAVMPEAKTVTIPLAPLKQVSQTQQAEAEYRKALALQQQGHVAEALAGYESALRLNSQLEEARLALASLFMGSRRSADAERVLREGLKIKPLQLGFTMALARVQVERGAIDSAIMTMEQNLSHADNKADYQAFYAALLQRQNRHKEAVNHYQMAIQLAPTNGVWLMGFGLSLQEIQRFEDAKAAYQKAIATQTLSPELKAFVEQKLKGL